LIVVIGMTGMIMTTAVGLLHSFFQADRAGREHVARGQSLARLEADFRDDAHAAVSVDASQAAAAEFALADSGRKVRYHETSDGLLREERLGSAVKRREAYRMAGRVKAVFHLEKDPPIVSLRIESARPGDPVDGPPIRIDAVLGNDHRYAKSGGPAK